MLTTEAYLVSCKNSIIDFSCENILFFKMKLFCKKQESPI